MQETCSKGEVHWSLRLLLTLGLAGVVGCASSQRAKQTRLKAGEFHRVNVRGIDNFYQLSGPIYSGAAPEGDTGFGELERLGVKTILSVDGTVPEVELATKHGLRYVHLPIGYDGVNHSNALRIVKAAEVMPGPLFIHCHHGTHRGPTAAALVCQGLQGWSPEQAEAWLRAAGTATNYPGLYRTVREFTAPTASELKLVQTNFVARARTPDLVQTMVQVDEHFDRLKMLERAGFKHQPEYPDVTATSESLALWELFKEAHRNGQGAEKGEAFLVEFKRGTSMAKDLYSALKALQPNSNAGSNSAESAFQDMAKSCARCHQTYRN